LARCGCRDKYIDKDAILTHQINNDLLIQQLDTLRSQLYIALGSPFQLQLVKEEDDGAPDYYSIGQYIIWQEDKQAELVGYQSFNTPLQYSINVYKQVLDKLSNGVIQLKLPIDNVIYIEEYKKRKRNKKKVVSFDDYVVQLKLGLVGYNCYDKERL